MKTILAILVLFVGAQVFAATDQQRIVFNCAGVSNSRLVVQVLEGGFAGTMIKVNRPHSAQRSYLVKQKPLDKRRMGAPTVYTGKGVSFSINTTTSPQAGGRLATFVTREYGEETLRCRR